MTLTELRYVVALAQTRHFGRAAERCFVSQPTLSVGIKKLEEEIGVQLFERGVGEITVTPVGEEIVEQAQRVLEEAQRIKQLAEQGKDPFNGPLRLGAIYTIAPYLLPTLVPMLKQMAPAMPLVIQENYTSRLLENLRHGELDCVILAQPFEDSGLTVVPLYEEPFYVLMPTDHPWAKEPEIDISRLTDETVLLLSAGNCFRDQVLAACPALAYPQREHAWQKTLEGSSLATIRYMVASGVGITVLPATAAMQDTHLVSRPLVGDQLPSRRVVLAARSSFPRKAVIDLIREVLEKKPLAGSTPIKR